MKEIDIKEILKAKAPKKAEKIPGFVYSIINKILCVRQINDHLRKYGDLMGIEFVRKSLYSMAGAKLEVSGLDNLTKSDRIIVASNHPLGGLDGLALIEAAYTARPNLVFPVNDFLMFVPNLREFFIPINKVGKNSRTSSIQLTEAFNSDKTILYFPAGLCSRKIKGKITDLEWKKTFIKQAVLTQRDIVPTYINGRNSNFFYNIAKIRKFFKIKFNIEMMLLPREMFRQKNKTIKITFGEPIPWQTFDSSKTEKQWAEYVKSIVFNKLKNLKSEA